MKTQFFNKENYLLYGGIGFTVIVLAIIIIIIFIVLHNKKTPAQTPAQTPAPIKPKSCYLSANPDTCEFNKNET
jgi:hypothetical protein